MMQTEYLLARWKGAGALVVGLALCLFPLATQAGPDNIAPQAKVTASTTLNADFAAAKVTDGIIGVAGRGEWASEGDTTDWGYIRFPWIELRWQEPRTIGSVLLYDRPSPKDHIAGGRLQFSDGTEIWVNQIPNDGTAKAIRFAPKKVEWIKFVTTDGKGRDLGFSEIEVFPARADYTDYVSWVDPYIETNRGRYFFFVTGGRPFGMVGAAPHTRNKNQNGGGYNYNETEILGFGQIHNWMMSGLEIMPATAEVDPRQGERGWKSYFTHDDEIVQPGYQRVFLHKYRNWVELTATERVSFYRFTYTRDAQAQIIANLGGYLANSTMAGADVKRVSTTELEGSFSSVDRYWGGPKDVKVFFVIQFDKAFDELKAWKGKQLLEGATQVQGDSAGIAALYQVKGGDQLQMKIGISYTSIQNARQNLQQECPGWDFDAVRAETRTIWNDWLGKMAVSGGTEAQRTKFYTDLWHVLLGRHKINDLSGDYPDRTRGTREGTFTDAEFKVRQLPKNKDGSLRFNMYNSDAWWLSQWNLNVLWGLAWPEVQDEMSASMLQYAEWGYLLPRGPAGGGYSYIMTSCPATNLIASTFQKGLLTKANPKRAFQLIKQNHLPGGMLGDAADIEFYTERGYWPGNAGITIEAAFQDWAIAQMADKLGLRKDRDFFSKRSQSWRNLYKPDQKLLFPKDREGNFMHNNPLSGAGWVEANAWQGSWGVSHAIGELAGLMGSADTLTSMLNYAFEQAQPSDFVFAYNDGYVSYANQPGCSNAHVFSYAGKPWLTQYWVRQVKEQAYGGVTPDQGYGGHDEDQGQMGGVSALMAIGLFNLQGNAAKTPVYDITSPIFDEVVIQLDPKYYKGKQFTIRTHNNSPENMYIQRATLNGQELSTFWFTHEDYAKGGTLELWLGPEPNKAWGVGALPPGVR
ncbi:GH92 family glycosyl hydrolase [Cesiribacter andamanensis]|uniref:Putative alpha-1,2-mannosidase n=1 Tax=Cesiribacter andamanensis AMV16 TaxID=1279009 RepID=M7NR34_9BACT|nr:GH92 family glycosyl hydrolase [Cesiribacter andamanensis]EMR00969.1 Putative alpha-1,2-mannosidase [Cesiribacter andamanensis AMV16]